jgi:site-specific DNA-methyltransferase (adenine-specific)
MNLNCLSETNPMEPTINLYHGDCMEAMRAMKDKAYDLAIVDPPYGLGEKLTSGGTWSVKWQAKGADWDAKPTEEYFNELFRVSKDWIPVRRKLFFRPVAAL